MYDICILMDLYIVCGFHTLVLNLVALSWDTFLSQASTFLWVNRVIAEFRSAAHNALNHFSSAAWMNC